MDSQNLELSPATEVVDLVSAPMHTHLLRLETREWQGPPYEWRLINRQAANTAPSVESRMSVLTLTDTVSCTT